MDLYEFVAECMERGLDSFEAEEEWEKAKAEMHEAFLENYYDDPMVHEGWAQQDVIDLYRFER